MGYIDWSITVPLQMIEFNLILKAAGKTTTAAGFWKLLLGTVMMLAFGYMGEESIIPAWPGFAVGMCGWGFILFEIFSGEAGGLAGDCSPAVSQSFDTMRNVVYNVADFVNKIAFVLACWSCAKADSAE